MIRAYQALCDMPFGRHKNAIVRKGALIFWDERTGTACVIGMDNLPNGNTVICDIEPDAGFGGNVEHLFEVDQPSELRRFVEETVG